MINGSACRRSMDLDQQTDVGEVQSVFGYEYGDSFFGDVGLVLKGFNEYGDS